MDCSITWTYMISCLCILAVHCTINTVRYRLRRVGARLADDQATQTSIQPSLFACSATCAINSTCMTLSFNTEDGRCLLSTWDMSDYTIVAEDVWITIANSKYTVYSSGGVGGRYSVPWEDAASVCEEEGSNIASYSDVIHGQSLGLHGCLCSWMNDELQGFILAREDTSCWPVYNGPGVIYCIRTTSNVWCRF